MTLPVKLITPLPWSIAAFATPVAHEATIVVANMVLTNLISFSYLRQKTNVHKLPNDKNR